MNKKKTLAKLQRHKIAGRHAGTNGNAFAIAITRSGLQSPLRKFPNWLTTTKVPTHSHSRLLFHAFALYLSIVTRTVSTIAASAECFAKRPPCTSNSCHWCGFISTLCVILLLQIGCNSLPNKTTGKIKYANPPTVGSWLPSQRELMACDTIIAARFMGDFGFLHPQCKQLDDIGPREYQVKSREIVQLREGPMWLVRVKNQERVYFVPIPWHDWL